MYDNERKLNAVAQLQQLWVDSPQWISSRKEEWKLAVRGVFSEESAKDLKTFGEYFVHGRLTGYIPAVLLYLFTPYNSPETAKLVFESDLFGWQERRTILTKYVFSAPKEGADMPWVRDHIVFFIEGVLGHEYKEVKEKVGKGEEIISLEPTAWCLSYVTDARKLMDGKVAYSACVDSIDYFVSALEHASHPRFRKYLNIDELISRAGAKLDNPNASELVSGFACNILSRKAEILGAWKASES